MGQKSYVKEINFCADFISRTQTLDFLCGFNFADG